MRSVSLVLFAMLLALSGNARGGDFEKAAELYDQGEFSEAKQLYEALVARGEWSANLFYNLGNADFRSDAPGKAILNYERALALDSTHAEARANLQWLRDQTGARLAERPWWDYALPPVSENVFAIVGAVAAWGALFGVVALCFGRRAWGWLVLAVLIAAYSAAGFWWREKDASLAIITAKEAVARLAPADRASVAESLPAGSRVRVLSERGEWIYCALPGGGLGWISEQQLAKVRLSKT